MPDSSIPQPSTPQSNSRLRAPAHALVVLIAAIGSIATSPARWHVAATPVPKASSGKGQLVTIEASAEPAVTLENGPVTRRLRPEGTPGAWTGRAEYFIPPSETLKSVEIMGTCSGGFCSKCEPPPGAYARVASTVEVDPWTLDATFAPAKIELNAPNDYPSFRVVVAATRPPALAIKMATPIAAGFYVSEAPGGVSVDPKDDVQGGMKRYAFSVTWHKESHATVAPISAVWTPIATISGYCKEAGPCVAPNDERVLIVSVEGPPGSGAASTSPPPGAAPVGP